MYCEHNVQQVRLDEIRETGAGLLYAVHLV